MTNDVNFDVLARKAIGSNGAIEDLDELYGEAFALPDWHFIARGTFPDVNPYIASNAEYTDGQQLVRAFTDTNRLQRFAKENNLTQTDGSALILSVPTVKIIDYLEQFIALGVHGIWFNSDTQSDGFFVPLKQLRPIKEHLAKLNRPDNAGQKTSDPQKPALVTLIIVVKDGLMLPSGFVAPSSYTCNFFCRVPADWTDGEHINDIYLERIYEKVYGDGWRAGNSDGSRYIVQDSFSKVFTPETVKSTKWSGTENDKDNHFWFYIATETGEVRNVTAEEFQKNIDLSFQTDAVPAKATDLSISTFQQGSVKPDTSLTPFFTVIALLLKNYAGSGEFTEMFSPGTGQNDMSDLFEDIASNAHGAYLKYKSYTFRRFGTESPIEIKTIGSNRLKHVETGERLIVNFTLSKITTDSAAKLIVRFLGRESEVEKLLSAIKPALESCEFKVLLETKGAPLSESQKLLED